MNETIIQWEVEDSDGDIAVLTIHGEVEPFQPGRTSGPPELCYPDEGGCASIVAILDEDGRVWPGELEPAERDAIEEALVEQEERDRVEDEEEAAIARFEAQREEGGSWAVRVRDEEVL